MKKTIYSIFLFFTATLGFSQSTFWTENFGTGCNKGQLASGFTGGTGMWTATPTGNNDTYSNVWFVSAVEAGMGVGNCGDGCSNNGSLTNRTLHISANFFSIVDLGASYLSGNGNFDSDIRVESPIINASGKVNIKLQFNYILQGIANSDYFDVVYSNNGGSTWSNVSTPPAVSLGTCSPQGKWATYSVTLPAGANNSSNLKIGFRWQNVDPNGSDPGVAIDDLALSTNTTFTPSFTMTGPLCPGGTIQVTANTGTVVASGYTWTAAPVGPSFSAPNASVTNITFGGANTYTITLSVSSGTNFGTVSNTIVVNSIPNAVTFTASPNPVCSGQSVTLTAIGATNYTWFPGNAAANPIVYTPGSTTTYTVKSSNGPCLGNQATQQVTVTTCTGIQEMALYNNSFTIYPNPSNGEFTLDVNSTTDNISYAVYNNLGQLLVREKISTNKTPVNIKSFPQGIYHVVIFKDTRVIYKTKVEKN